MDFPKFLEMKFVDWQKAEGGRKTLYEFAQYLGISQVTLSSWMNKTRSPNKENAVTLSAILGMEVFDILEISRPDPDLIYIQRNWGQLTDETRKALRDMAVNNMAGNIKAEEEDESKTSYRKRKAKPT